MQRIDVLGAVRALTYLIFFPIIAGCGGDSDEDARSALALDAGELVATTVTVTGSVGDGPITSGRVVIENSSGQVLATQRSNEQANYRIQLNAGRNEFPLLVRVDDGIDLVTGDAPSFELISTVLEPGEERIANLNPAGTLAVKVAQLMGGGLSGENLATAIRVVNAHFGFGLDARGITNPITADVGKQNAASIVRSSEAVGEVIRRTLDVLTTGGRVVSADELVDALSADLVDGSLDGRGVAGTDGRLAATASVVSAQVMLETMTNRLEVGGVRATGALDASIQQIMAGDLTAPLTGTLNVTGSMLSQARVLVDAAMLIDNSPELLSVRDALAASLPGQSPAQLRNQLPPKASDLFDTTIMQTIFASDEELAAVNDAIRDAAPPDDPVVNHLPSIAGVPATVVMPGDAYQFVPIAADQDGDELTFAIANMPPWASFDTSNGRLAGMPIEADVALYADIRITASDGYGSVDLAAFSIKVTGRPNQRPTISGDAPGFVTVGNLFDFTPTATDPDGDTLSFSIAGLPDWAGFDPGTGRLSGVPDAARTGVYSGIQITVSDGDDRASLLPFSITVSGLPNQAPTIGGVPATQVMVGNSYVFTPTAIDLDGENLSFSIAGKPAWASFDGVSGRLAGTPADGEEGVYTGIHISVSDGRDTAALPAFAIAVDATPNAVPTISGSPGGSVTVGSAYSFTPAATDADGDSLSFSVAGRPAWASFDPGTGRLFGTPAAGNEGTYPDIRISVSDGRDSMSLTAFSIRVDAPPNSAPTISGAPTGVVSAGDQFSFTPAASDPDGDELTFSITGRPVWASFSSATGELSGTPVADDVGDYSGIRISVSDGQDSASLPAFAIIVTGPPNRAPTISGVSPTTVTAGTAYSFQPTASDPDGDTLTFSIVGRPVWTNFDASSGQLAGTPAAADVGIYPDIRISVSDGQQTISLPAFAVTVSDVPNRAPTISGVPTTSVTVDDVYAFTPSATDPDGNTLTFSIAGQPLWASFDVSSGRLSGAPSAGDEGTYSGIRISVSDSMDTASLPEFAVVVNGLPNTAPTISGVPATAVTVESAYAFTPSANDADGDTLSFSIVGRPGWASFDPATGRLFGVPSAGDEGVYSRIRITVFDGQDSASLPAFAITVNELPNIPPTISGAAPSTVTVGDAYSFTPTASDADGDTLSFSIDGRPAWAGFNPGTGRLSGTPADGDEGTYGGIVITVSDSENSASLDAFSITVNERPNQPPMISGTPATDVTVGSAYSFRPSASDADGDSLNFSIAAMPAWASFDSGTGRLSGTPVAGEEGVYSGIRISVSDGEDSASLTTFAITVNELPNVPPTISGTPPTAVTVGDAYSFTPNASDPDGDTLSFSIVAMPAWASFDAGTGRLSGTPSAGEEGVYSGIRISVSDGDDSASLPTFAISVSGLPNQPPTIGGTPAPEVMVGDAYSFTPTANDPDGDTLSFSITSMPAWAGFDTDTGELSGTPIAGEEGTYSGIVISVSDGSETVSLPPFSIAVVAQTLGTASLTWDAPVENADGTVLDDLDGFYVHYGTDPSDYSHTVKIDDETITAHFIENLVPGTWYFVVTAYDTSDNESVYSERVSKVIP